MLPSRFLNLELGACYRVKINVYVCVHVCVSVCANKETASPPRSAQSRSLALDNLYDLEQLTDFL